MIIDRHVNVERIGFNIPREKDSLFQDTVSMDEIETSIIIEVKRYLADYLKPVKDEKASRISHFVATHAPQYRSTIKYMADALDQISPDVSDERLDIELYKIRSQLQTEIKERTQQIIDDNTENIDDASEYLDEYDKLISQISEISTDQLAEYVLYGKSIISLLDKSLAVTGSGKYALEETVHRIIFPMRTTSNEIDYEKQNLWLIDERLSYHYFLSSDKRLDSIEEINSDSEERPDILIFNKALAYTEASVPYSSVVIIEFKRPMRNDYQEDDNPFAQVIRYITEIRASRAVDRRGRPITVNDNTPFYAFIICDITSKIRYLAENSYDYTPTPDGEGYFNFNKKLKAYIELVSYSKLVNDAKKRNRVLFEKLNLPAQ